MLPERCCCREPVDVPNDDEWCGIPCVLLARKVVTEGVADWVRCPYEALLSDATGLR